MKLSLVLVLAVLLAGFALAPRLLAATPRCSIDSKTPVTIAIVNRSEHQTLDIFWVDFHCNEIARGTLVAGQRWDQQTYISHPFRIRDQGTGRLVREFVTDASTPVITFVP